MRPARNVARLGWPSVRLRWRRTLHQECRCVANELVEWLNLVDTSYRQEFRELFEANFGRVDTRMAGLEARVDARLRAMEMRIAGLETVMGSRMSDLETRLLALVDAKLEKQKSALLIWMFVFWVGTMGTVLAMLKL